MKNIKNYEQFLFEQEVLSEKISLDGQTMEEIVSIAKPGDKLEPVNLAFGMRHDKWKTARLEDKEYTIRKIILNYARKAHYISIIDTKGTLFSIIFDPNEKTGFKLKK